MSAPNQATIERAVAAYDTFCAQNPDFIVSEANATLLGEAVQRLRLPFDQVKSLQMAWVSIRPAPARKPKTPAPAPAAAPAPAVRESLLSPERIDAEARRRIDAGEISREIVSGWSAKELARQSQLDLATARAIEILYERKPVEPSRGDVVHSFGQATLHHTDLGNEIIRTVDARLAPTIATANPSPSATSQRSKGFVTTASQHAPSTRRQPTLAQALAREKADRKFIDESTAKTARLIRVKANKQK